MKRNIIRGSGGAATCARPPEKMSNEHYTFWQSVGEEAASAHTRALRKMFKQVTKKKSRQQGKNILVERAED